MEAMALVISRSKPLTPFPELSELAVFTIFDFADSEFSLERIDVSTFVIMIRQIHG